MDTLRVKPELDDVAQAAAHAGAVRPPAAEPAIAVDAAPGPELVIAAAPGQEPVRTHGIATAIPPTQEVIPVPEPGNVPSAIANSTSDDLPYSAASRLGGLRNLLVTLGLRALEKNGETPAPDAAARSAERPVYAEPYRPAEAASAQHSQTQSVIAHPEFLPPRLPAEQEKEPEPPRAMKPPMPAHPDLYEDVRTLPSWRGQYRKRR